MTGMSSEENLSEDKEVLPVNQQPTRKLSGYEH